MLHPLSTEVVQRLRSGVAITSVSCCVDELVINAIDAGATCIAVRLNLPFYKIQVIDNGDGINKDQMEFIGVRYATSKCHSLHDLHNLKSGGFRGEALASLKDMSSVLMIESRSQRSEETYCKIFTHGRPPEVQKSCMDRPSKGTTVTVHNFMYNMPVRKQCISEVLDLEDCRKSLEKLALIYPQISFSLRSDTTGEIYLETRKCNSIKSAFRHLFGQEKTQNLREVSLKKESYDISGFVSTGGHITKDLQLMYVNKRFVHRSKLQKLVSAILKKFLFSRQKMANVKDRSNFSLPSHSPSKFQIRYAIFVINITCPYDEYDMILEPRKTLVEFTDWEKVLKILEEVIFKFLKDNGHWSHKDSIIELSTENSSVNFLDDDNSHNFPSDLGKTISAQDNKNGLFSIPIKRVISNHLENIPTIPPKKLLLSHDTNDPPLLTLSSNKFEDKGESSEKHTSLNDTCNDLSSECKEIKSNEPTKYNFKPQTSSLSFLNIPETDVCLKEISKILERQSGGKSKISREKTLKEKLTKQTGPLTNFGNFEFNVRNESSKFEVLKRHESIQTERHVTINPLVEEFHRPKNVSKYTFTDASYLEPLKRLKPHKSGHLKSRLFHKDMQQKQTKIQVPDKCLAPSHQSVLKNDKTCVDHRINAEMSSNDIFAQKTTNKKLHHHRKTIHQSAGKTSTSQNVGRKYSTDMDLMSSKWDSVHCVSHIQGIDKVLHEGDKHRNQRVTTVINKSSVGINRTRSLLHNHDKFRSLKRVFKSHRDTVICQSKNDSYLCDKSLSIKKMCKLRKQSPKEFLKSLSSCDRDHRKHLTSSPISFFSKHNIDIMRAKGRAILNSSPVECEFSKHGNIIGLKTPVRSHSLDFDSEIDSFHSPDYFSSSEEHLECESEFNFEPSHVIGNTSSNHKSHPISKSSRNGGNIYDHALKQDSQSSHMKFPFSQTLDDVDISCDAESSDDMEISHNGKLSPKIQNDSTMSKEKLRIWKEVPDSPPSPNQDDPESPELNLSLTHRLPLTSNLFTDSVKLPTNDGASFNELYVVPAVQDMLNANHESHNVQNGTLNETTLNPNLQAKISDVSIMSNPINKSNKSEKNEIYISKTFAISSPNTLTTRINELPVIIVSDATNTGESSHHEEPLATHMHSHWFMKSDPTSQKTDIAEKDDSTSLSLVVPLESTNTNIQEIMKMNDPSLFGGPLSPKPLTEDKEVPHHTKDVVSSHSLIACKLQSHIEKQEATDLFIKWKDHEMDFPGKAIEDLYSSWENPMFRRSSTEMESVNSTAATHNLATMYEILNSYRFSKKAFTHLQVIGQVDQKFIACMVADINENFKGKRLLVLFDQHAVHERVRLEELMLDFYETDESGCKQALSTPLLPPLEVELNQNESRLISVYSKHLKRLGIILSQGQKKFTFQIHAVPQCLLERANNELKRNRMLAISSLVESIIREWVILLEQTRNPVTVLPKTLSGILHSQACRGAIKFGDPLDRAQCVNLLETLSACNLPFQCAHGRPSLAPLLDLEKIDVCKKKPPPQLKKLSRLMRESHASLTK